MAKFKLIALASPVAGKEEEFHDWYQNQHLPQIIGLPGGVGAQRYKLVAKLMGSDENEWLAIYDIECDDPMQFIGGMMQANEEGKLTQTEANDMGKVYTALFAEYGERVGK
jgi:hypothetical protein